MTAGPRRTGRAEGREDRRTPAFGGGESERRDSASVSGRCTSLQNVTIPESVTSIGDWAFQGCADTKSIIPSSVKIGERAFVCTLRVCQYCQLPPPVASIGGWAFARASSLTSISIPASVQSVGDYAFKGCAGLVSIIFPRSLTSIGDGTFEACSSLTSFDIPDSVTVIGSYAFSRCTSIKSVTIPTSVTAIGDGAFAGCPLLTGVSVPSSVTALGDQAFATEAQRWRKAPSASKRSKVAAGNSAGTSIGNAS